MSTARHPVNAYPLLWPAGTPRTTARRRSPFYQTIKAEGGVRKFPRELYASWCELREELRRMGAVTPVISSMLRTKGDGSIWADQATSKIDPGVCVYWHMRVARGDATIAVPYSMPCDTYLRIEDNLYALALTIQAMRAIDRFGAVKTSQVFGGFAALPPGDASSEPVARPWREVLGGVWPEEIDAADTLILAKGRWRKALDAVHADKGEGDQDRAVELNRAYEEAQAELAAAAGAA